MHNIRLDMSRSALPVRAEQRALMGPQVEITEARTEGISRMPDPSRTRFRLAAALLAIACDSCERSPAGRCVLGAIGAMIFRFCSLAYASDAAFREQLSFDVQEGRNLNSFLRAGPVAAHLVLRSGADTRVSVAFPALSPKPELLQSNLKLM